MSGRASRGTEQGQRNQIEWQVWRRPWASGGVRRTECAHQVRVRLAEQLELRVEHGANVAISQRDDVSCAQVAGVEHAALAEERTLVQPAREAVALADAHTELALQQEVEWPRHV